MPLANLLRFACLALAALTWGCASSLHEPRTLTGQEAAATRKVYPGIGKDQIIAALRPALAPPGSEGFALPEFLDTPEGLRMSRNWLIYGILFVSEGDDYWDISIRPAADGSEVSLKLLLTTITERGRPPEGAAVYDLFWSRLDYVLGLTDRWVNCTDAKKKREQVGIGAGELAPLCGLGRADTAPERPAAVNVQVPAIAPDWRNPTRQEWLAITTRTYPGLNRSHLLDSATRVLTLADSRRFKVERGADFLFAAREWSIFFVIGNSGRRELWEVRTYGEEDNLTVWVYVTQANTGMLYFPSGMRFGGLDGIDERRFEGAQGPYKKVAAAYEPDGTPLTQTLRHRDATVFGAALYELFFARMEFLLGLRDDWMTCRESENRIARKIVAGSNSALCLQTDDDNKPPTR